MSSGVTASELMRRAGIAAASELHRLHGDRAREGVTVFTGSGNNGGDGWVVAGELAREFEVTVVEIAGPRSAEAKAARQAAMSSVKISDRVSRGVIVDALLGTGVRGQPREPYSSTISTIAQARACGTIVVALDIPSGLDATTGAHEGCVTADTTLAFGSVKRGELLARDVCGRLLALDIGLRPGDDTVPTLVGPSDVYGFVPLIPPDAHKGTRRKLAIVGGGEGMAGAALLAATAAFRSGVGLLRLCVAPGNVAAAHAGAPAALVNPWPTSEAEARELVSWADAIVVGPGLGNSAHTRSVIERIAAAGDSLLVLDADALNVFSGDLDGLARMLGGRRAVITPHPAELGRLTGIAVDDVLARRFELPSEVAAKIHATVLLKGAPTVIGSSTGGCFVSATGTAALATGGSGDVLSGMIGTLAAQTKEADASAWAAAWVHGRAAELATGNRTARGTTLEDVLDELPEAWQPVDSPALPVLADLPAVR